jgi:hypothetical protein
MYKNKKPLTPQQIRIINRNKQPDKIFTKQQQKDLEEDFQNHFYYIKKINN